MRSADCIEQGPLSGATRKEADLVSTDPGSTDLDNSEETLGRSHLDSRLGPAIGGC
jgi:hypothetical protein